MPGSLFEGCCYRTAQTPLCGPPTVNLAPSRTDASGKCDSEQARAKQNETGNGHGEETVRSEFIAHHGTPPNRSGMRPCSNRTTVTLHSQKDFARFRKIRI